MDMPFPIEEILAFGLAMRAADARITFHGGVAELGFDAKKSFEWTERASLAMRSDLLRDPKIAEAFFNGDPRQCVDFSQIYTVGGAQRRYRCQAMRNMAGSGMEWFEINWRSISSTPPGEFIGGDAEPDELLATHPPSLPTASDAGGWLLARHVRQELSLAIQPSAAPSAVHPGRL